METPKIQQVGFIECSIKIDTTFYKIFLKVIREQLQNLYVFFCNDFHSKNNTVYLSHL